MAAIWLWLLLMPCGASPWYARPWQVDEGLPGDSVTGVAQTGNGLLWISTQAGLAEFDGMRFRRIPMPRGRPYRIIRDLFLDRDEQLWLAEETGVLVRYATVSGEVREFSDGIPRAQPTDFAQTTAQAVWVAYADGSVCRVENNRVRRFTEPAGVSGAGAVSLTVDGSGRLWFFKNGRLGVFANEKFVTRTNLMDRTTVILGARAGGIFVCAGEQLLRYQKDGALVELARLPAGQTTVRPTRLLEEASGALWVGTLSHGLFRLEGTNLIPVETSHGRIKTIATDREGNVWVGTDGGGLNRLRQRVVELRGKEEGLPFDTVRSTCEDAEGAPWVVTQNGNVARLMADRWRVFTPADGWQGFSATCIAADAQGVIHIGTFNRGIHRWRDGKFITPINRPEGLARPGIRGLFPDRRGNLWIAFSGGDTLQRYRAGEFQNYALPPGSRAVRTMTETADGTIWMANLDAQLLRVNGNEIVDETGRTPEPFRTIRCLTGTPDGSLWIGYSVAGLGRLKDGKFTRINRERGLTDDSICSLVADARGWMWFGSDHGIFRARVEELHLVMENEAKTLKCFTHGRNDGLPSLQAYYGYFPGATRTRDERILIPTHSGLAIVRPDLVPAELTEVAHINRLAPPVIIEAIALDGRELTNATADSSLTLPPGHRRLEFRYTAPSFIDPENIQFRVKLDGWDDDWVKVGKERLIRYPRLPAGPYQFRVVAEYGPGAAAENSTTVRFAVLPFFWQQWWFIAGVGGAFTAVVFSVARYVSVRRLRRKVQLLEQENALQQERARIARDIHDDIGARMTQISLLAELTQQAVERPNQVQENVAQMATMTRQGMRALDEIVWAVNPRNDTLQDLLDFGGQYAVDFLRAAGLSCRVDFPVTPQSENLPAGLRHALLMVLKEALNNVVKHARATEVWLRAEIQGGVIRWEIADNGRGFESPPADAFADGLRNMKQRLAEFGGNCVVESAPGAGVKITFSAPVTAARKQ
jgi:signal transduction histidine kinase/ligand-binding sensor domain-containing protein